MDMLAAKYTVDYRGVPMEIPSEIPVLLPLPTLCMNISMVMM